MKEFHIVFKFMSHIARTLFIEGVLALAAGVLIILFPDLLGILVGVLLVISAIVAFVLAWKVYTYSKITIKL